MKPIFFGQLQGGSAPVSYSFIVRDGHTDLFRSSDNNLECEQSAGSTLSRWIPQQPYVLWGSLEVGNIPTSMPLVPELWMDKSGGLPNSRPLSFTLPSCRHRWKTWWKVLIILSQWTWYFVQHLVLDCDPGSRKTHNLRKALLNESCKGGGLVDCHPLRPWRRLQVVWLNAFCTFGKVAARMPWHEMEKISGGVRFHPIYNQRLGAHPGKPWMISSSSTRSKPALQRVSFSRALFSPREENIFSHKSWKWKTTLHERKLILEGPTIHWTMLMGGRVCFEMVETWKFQTRNWRFCITICWRIRKF